MVTNYTKRTVKSRIERAKFQNMTKTELKKKKKNLFTWKLTWIFFVHSSWFLAWLKSNQETFMKTNKNILYLAHWLKTPLKNGLPFRMESAIWVHIIVLKQLRLFILLWVHTKGSQSIFAVKRGLREVEKSFSHAGLPRCLLPQKCSSAFINQHNTISLQINFATVYWPTTGGKCQC